MDDCLAHPDQLRSVVIRALYYTTNQLRVIPVVLFKQLPDVRTHWSAIKVPPQNKLAVPTI